MVDDHDIRKVLAQTPSEERNSGVESQVLLSKFY